MTSIAVARWMEPIGQAIAFVAFGLQFFIVDPASNNALRGAIENQRVMLANLGRPDAARPGNLSEAKKEVANQDLQKSLLDAIAQDDGTRKTWRIWLFLTFAAGAVLTIVGKAAAIRYSTK